MSDSTRVDRWLWAIRVFKTRGDVTDACRGGHVRANGSRAKPAATVRVGDRVEARAHQVDRVLEAVAILDKRVGAAVATEWLAQAGWVHQVGDPDPVPTLVLPLATAAWNSRQLRVSLWQDCPDRGKVQGHDGW